MQRHDAPSRLTFIGLCVLLCAAVVTAYGPALSAGFIWDDDAYVTNNPLLTAEDGWQRIWFSAHRQSQFFPLVYSTLRLEHGLWGLDPFGYHLVNVLMHAANAILVWILLRRLFVPGAWIAAALFALHPVQVESVAWITELKNTQSTLFCLLALLAWQRFTSPTSTPRRRDYALALGFHLLALLSKTTACTLPAALLLLPWMQGARIDRRRVLQVVPFVVLGLLAGLVSIWWEAHLGNYADDVGQHLSWLQRTLIASKALWFYAAQLAWPANLAFSYPRFETSAADASSYVPLLGCALVVFAVWWYRKRMNRGVIAGIAFFAATLSILLGFIPLYTFRYTFVADHYQYFACVGLLAIAAAGLDRLPRAVPIALLACLGYLTWKQAHVYRDPTTLWQDTLAKNPASWMAHNNLGRIHADSGAHETAIEHYREALRLDPDYAQASYNLGISLFAVGRHDEGMVRFEDALRLDPRDARAHYNYALALEWKGNAQTAIERYQAALRLDPNYFAARINLGIALSREGRIEEASMHFAEAVRLKPDDVEARNNLGAVLRAQQRLDEAAVHFRAAVRLDPTHALAHTNLGAVLLEQGRIAEAISALEQALRLDPSNAGARSLRARAIAQPSK